MATDDDDLSEVLDEDVLTSEYPPERPLGATDYGTTAQEERIDEPDVLEATRHDRPVLLLDETEDAFGAGGDIDAGETGDELLGEVGEATWAGDDDGPGLGPPPSHTVADRVPLSAEEAAVHIVDVEGEDKDFA